MKTLKRIFNLNLKKYILSIAALLFLSFTFSSNPPGWFIQYTPTNGRLINDISFLDSLNGWAVTDFGSGQDSCFILRTSNGGNNWFIEYSKLNAAFYGVKFFSDNIGYVSGASSLNGNGFVLKTSNKGQNWSQTNFPTGNPPLSDMSFINSDTGWVCADAVGFGGVWRTIDGGLSWLQQVGGQTVKSIFFVDRNTGWYSRESFLFLTTNGGNNWIEISRFPSNVVRDIFFKNSDTGWATCADNNKGIYKSTNSGLNWVAQLTPTLGYTASEISFVTDYNIWTGGAGFRVFKLISDSTWGYQSTPTFTNLPIDFIDSLNGWSGTNSIIHTTDGGGPITSIESNNTSIPDEFILNQNYPNPFNPVTVISYQLTVSSYITLKVYDVHGRIIKTIVNQKQNAGSYEIEFDGSNLSSGVYYYTLGTELGSITKKMILIR